jgi:hypothetical protein
MKISRTSLATGALAFSILLGAPAFAGSSESRVEREKPGEAIEALYSGAPDVVTTQEETASYDTPTMFPPRDRGNLNK